MTRLLVVGVVGVVLTAVLARAARSSDGIERGRRLGGRGPRRLPGPVRVRAARLLDAAGVDVEPEQAVELWTLSWLVVPMVVGAVSLPLALPALVAALVGPVAWLRVKTSRNARLRTLALPGVVEAIAADLRGGATVDLAIAGIGARPGPLAADLRRVHDRTRLGAPLDDALSAWAVARDDDAVRSVAGALAVASALGGRAAGALDGLASSLRHRLDAIAEARALSAQARASAVVVGVAPVAFLGVSAVLDPTAATSLFTTGVGLVCLVVGGGLELLAVLWIRHILRSAER